MNNDDFEKAWVDVLSAVRGGSKDSYFRSLADYKKLFDDDSFSKKGKWTSSSTGTSSAPKQPAKPKQKFQVARSFDLPSGKVFTVAIEDPEVGAYIFSEYKFGEDWFESTNTTLMVKEKVLLDITLRYGS